jgi:uncharacterized protein YqgC (DUF456 family)
VKTFIAVSGAVGIALGIVLVWVLCLVGLLLSCLAISGTWLVVAAAVLANLLRGWPAPGWWAVLVFAILSALVEAAEALAGAWGVKRRGGSWLASLAAFAGGIIGLILGSSMLPVVGSLLGMVLVSFALVFAVEKYRLKKSSRAADIAWGTVLSRVLVMLLKVVATLGMSVYLLVALHARP